MSLICPQNSQAWSSELFFSNGETEAQNGKATLMRNKKILSLKSEYIYYIALTPVVRRFGEFSYVILELSLLQLQGNLYPMIIGLVLTSNCLQGI